MSLLANSATPRILFPTKEKKQLFFQCFIDKLRRPRCRWCHYPYVPPKSYDSHGWGCGPGCASLPTFSTWLILSLQTPAPKPLPWESLSGSPASHSLPCNPARFAFCLSLFSPHGSLSSRKAGLGLNYLWKLSQKQWVWTPRTTERHAKRRAEEGVRVGPPPPRCTSTWLQATLLFMYKKE